MSVFQHSDFDHHEQVVFCADRASGLRAIIALHNSRLGPALGGCRMWPYASDDEALRDVLRLARGMSYKSALAGLAFGGGKSVIIGNPRADKSPALLRAFGRFLNSLGGRYIAAEDSGITVDDIRLIAGETRYVAGIEDKITGDGSLRSGDPSPATAYGVFVGLQAAVKQRMGRDPSDLAGIRVAIQGVGSVGLRLGRYLKDAGCTLWVSDIYPDQADRAASELGASVVEPNAVFDLDVDVFAPCALGAVVNDHTLGRLKAKVIAGCANNQLAEPRHGYELAERGILYAPDYVINAGGIIDIAHERQGFERKQMTQHVERIHATLLAIFERAAAQNLPPEVIADRLAERRLQG